MKVAILGGAARPQHWPYYFAKARKGWEIWGLNSIRPTWAGRFDRMFNLHRLAHLKRDCPDYIEWDTFYSFRHPKVPIYVVDSWKGLLKNQVIFPLKALQHLPRGGKYHASSIDMMVAYALHLKATQIAIHGINFHMESGEPISARACLEYWCGIAEGRGVKVTTAPDCQLFYQFHYVRSRSIYGFDDVHIIEDRAK